MNMLCYFSLDTAMIPIAELAAYRDIPVFGWLSNEESLDDKNKLQTLVRSIAPLSSIGNPPPLLPTKHCQLSVGCLIKCDIHARLILLHVENKKLV